MINFPARYWYIVVLRVFVAVRRLGFVLGCSSDQERWASHVEKARNYIKSSEFRSAEIEIKNALVQYHLGMSYYKKGQNALAKELLRIALALDNQFEGAPADR